MNLSMKKLLPLCLLVSVLSACGQVSYESLDKFTDNMLREINANETRCSGLAVSAFNAAVGGETRCATYLFSFESFKEKWEKSAKKHFPRNPEVSSSWAGQSIGYNFGGGFEYVVIFQPATVGNQIYITSRGNTLR